MGRSMSLALGVALVLIGLLWTGQGLGLIGGSFMTGATVWAVIGPLTALAGVYLLARGMRRGDGMR
jgi:hypothetical protein